jgi:hypothetical protein
VYPLDPSQMMVIPIESLPDGLFDTILMGNTWAFTDDLLTKVNEHLIEQLQQEKNLSSSILVFKVFKGQFPYHVTLSDGIFPILPCALLLIALEILAVPPVMIEHSSMLVTPPIPSTTSQPCQISGSQV